MRREERRVDRQREHHPHAEMGPGTHSPVSPLLSMFEIFHHKKLLFSVLFCLSNRSPGQRPTSHFLGHCPTWSCSCGLDPSSRMKQRRGEW